MLIAVFVATILFSGCATSKIDERKQDTLTLGAILMLTGPGASWGTASKNAIEMAVADINADNGILGQHVRVVYEDDTGDAKKSLSAFRKLTESDGASFLIGTTWSTTGLPLIDVAREKGVVMISPSLGKPEFNESNPRLFNTWPHDFILSEHLADRVYADGHRRVALFGAQEVWVIDQSATFKKRFEMLGGEVVYMFEPQIDEKQVGADVLKVQAEKNIDAIVYTNTLYNLGILTAKKMQEFGVALPAYSLTLDNDVIKRAQGAYDDMIFLTFLTPTDEFAKRYEEQYGLAVDIGADSAYDAVMMLAEAVRETASTDPAIVAAYLNGITEYNGASGHLVSDGKGGFTKDYVTKVIRHGTAVTIE